MLFLILSSHQFFGRVNIGFHLYTFFPQIPEWILSHIRWQYDSNLVQKQQRECTLSEIFFEIPTSVSRRYVLEDFVGK